MGSVCVRRSLPRAQRCAARLDKLCMCLQHVLVCWQVTREQAGQCAYAELQRKHRAAYGDNEEAREAAGKAALLRAKALHSPGWAARLRCEERGRLAAASVRRLRGVRQQVHRARARESHGPWRKRERERPRLQSVSVSWCLPVSVRTSAWVGAVFARVHKDQRIGRYCQRLRTRAKVSRNYARALWASAL